MKNKFFMYALLVGAALALTACPDKPGTDPEEPKGTLAIKPTEVVLANGETLRLAATLDGKTISDVKWETSNEDIVTVDAKGMLTASEENEGEATITATRGDQKATCKVTVTEFLKTINFTNSVMWDIDTTAYSDSVYTITTGDGSQQYRCYMAEATLFVLSEGIFLNTTTWGLDGSEQGAVVIVKAPMYYGTEYLNGVGKGAQFSLGAWGIVPDTVSEPVHHGTFAGKLEQEAEYVRLITEFFTNYVAQDYTAAQTLLDQANELTTGTTMSEINYRYNEETQTSGYSWDLFPSLVKKLYFVPNTNGYNQYMMGMDYFSMEVQRFSQNTLWGCGVEFDEAKLDENQIVPVDNKVHYETENLTYEFGEEPKDEIRANVPMHLRVLKHDNPIAAQKLMEQVKNKNNNWVRM